MTNAEIIAMNEQDITTLRRLLAIAESDRLKLLDALCEVNIKLMNKNLAHNVTRAQLARYSAENVTLRRELGDAIGELADLRRMADRLKGELTKALEAVVENHSQQKKVDFPVCQPLPDALD